MFWQQEHKKINILKITKHFFSKILVSLVKITFLFFLFFLFFTVFHSKSLNEDTKID